MWHNVRLVRDKTQCIKLHSTSVLLHGLGRIVKVAAGDRYNDAALNVVPLVMFITMSYAAGEVAVTRVRSCSSDGVH